MKNGARYDLVCVREIAISFRVVARAHPKVRPGQLTKFAGQNYTPVRDGAPTLAF